MNLITVSSMGWHKKRSITSTLVCELCEGRDGLLATLDEAAISRGKPQSNETLQAHEINLGDWLKKHTEEYRLDLRALTLDALHITPKSVILLDASGYPAHVLEDLAIGIRQAWFALPDWPTALILVADDADLLTVSEFFMDVFYLRPRGLNAIEVRRMSKRLTRKATLARWFGIKASRLHRGVGRLLDFAERMFSVDERLKSQRATKWKH